LFAFSEYGGLDDITGGDYCPYAPTLLPHEKVREGPSIAFQKADKCFCMTNRNGFGLDTYPEMDMVARPEYEAAERAEPWIEKFRN